MGVLGRTAVLAAIVLGMAPAAGFGQTGPAAPPAEQGPDAGGGGPAAPEGQPPAPVLPLPPDVLPGPDFAPGMGGRDCEHERAPGIGVWRSGGSARAAPGRRIRLERREEAGLESGLPLL